MRIVDYPRRGRAGARRWLPSWRLVLASAVAFGALVVGAFVLAVALTPIPEPSEVASAQTSIVYWNDGTTELGRIGDVNRTDVPLSDVPIAVQHAVLAAEDRNFYDHGGFSPVGIGRAVWNNVSGGSTQGGSTITQQYAKNAFLTQERSWTRKLKELVLATKLETSTSKDEILGKYLNAVYFGRGAYGIEAAAQAYFRVPAKDLTPVQGAMLASLLKSPEGMSPDRNLERLKARWGYVMDGMVEQGWMSKKARAKAAFPKVAKRSSASTLGGTNGYLLDAVRQDLLANGIDEAALGVGGLRIVSTFDKNAQAAAVAAVKDEAPTEDAEGLRVGLVAVKPGTGQVVALYGGADYLRSPLNNATQAIGQAGSTFKPFALAAALEKGTGLDSMWNGDNGRDIGGYKVVNYGDKSWGEISLLEATENSVNSVYVDVENTVGVDAVADAAVRAGIPEGTTGFTKNLTFVLGTSSPHVIDLASSYATFAARGQRVAPTTLLKVTGPNGGVLVETSPAPEQVFDSAVADQVNYALEKVVTDGTGSTAQGLDRPAAGKTGTTNDNMSAWFVGYTPDLAAAVMLVKDGSDGQPVSLSGTGGLDTVTGGSFPASIWTAFMRGALEGVAVSDFVPPADLVTTSPSPSASSPTAPPKPTPTPTDTGSPTPTPTDTGTPTPTPTDTGTPTPTPTPTDTGPEPSPTAASPRASAAP